MIIRAGFRRMARANPRRNPCPASNCSPCSPSTVSNPCGRSKMNLLAWACLAAAVASCSEYSLLPQQMFSRTVPVKNGSAAPTKMVSARSDSSVTQAISSPSNSTRPFWGSINRGKNRPRPGVPCGSRDTIETVLPAAMRRSRSSNTGRRVRGLIADRIESQHFRKRLQELGSHGLTDGREFYPNTDKSGRRPEWRLRESPAIPKFFQWFVHPDKNDQQHQSRRERQPRRSAKFSSRPTPPQARGDGDHVPRLIQRRDALLRLIAETSSRSRSRLLWNCSSSNVSML